MIIIYSANIGAHVHEPARYLIFSTFVNFICIVINILCTPGLKFIKMKPLFFSTIDIEINTIYHNILAAAIINVSNYNDFNFLFQELFVRNENSKKIPNSVRLKNN